MRRLFLLALVAAFVSVAAPAADWQNLFANGLAEWEILGDGIWDLRPDGVLLAYRRPDKAALFSQDNSITRKKFATTTASITSKPRRRYRTWPTTS
jgi:hypothetical protein